MTYTSGFPQSYTRTQRVPIVSVVTPPVSFVDLADVKSHLRVEHDEDDDLIQIYIDAAIAMIDGPSGYLGRALGPQTLELATWRYDGLASAWPPSVWSPRVFDLPFPPLIEVVSVVYDDADGAEQTLDAGDWTLRRSAIEITSLPSYDELRIRYRAGYIEFGTSPEAEAVPASVKAAVKLMVGDLYANRSSTVAGAVSSIPMSTTVQALLNPLRVFALA